MGRLFLCLALLMLTGSFAEQSTPFGEIEQPESNQQYFPEQSSYIEAGQAVEDSQAVQQASEQQQEQEQLMQEQMPVQELQDQSQEYAQEDQSQVFSMPDEQAAVQMPQVRFPPGFPAQKASPPRLAARRNPIPAGFIEQALGTEHAHPKITRTYLVTPSNGGDEPDELDQASAAVADAIVNKAKEIKSEKAWVKQVLAMVAEMNGKVEKVRDNIEVMRKATLGLLKKKRQIDNAKIQKKLEAQLAAAQADLDGLHTALKRVKTKKQDFDKNKQTLASTISTLEKQLATLRADPTGAPAAALLEADDAFLEQSAQTRQTNQNTQAEKVQAAPAAAETEAIAPLKHARGTARHSKRVSL